jgi:hypothetical protein
VQKEERNKANIKFRSKFIFYYISAHLCFEKNKTKTVGLRYKPERYSKDFLKGFLLGLMLTDGYLKTRFCFNSISERLSVNANDILEAFGLKPRIFRNKRKKYGWNDLYSVYLVKKESKIALDLLDKTLAEAGYKKGSLVLKGYEV